MQNVTFGGFEVGNLTFYIAQSAIREITYMRLVMRIFAGEIQNDLRLDSHIRALAASH